MTTKKGKPQNIVTAFTMHKLENRIAGKMGCIETLIVVIVLSTLISMIVLAGYVEFFAPQYTEVSPCELGLMEWEETEHISASIGCITINCSDTEQTYYCQNGTVITKSCPSKMKIMVVKS